MPTGHGQQWQFLWNGSQAGSRRLRHCFSPSDQWGFDDTRFIQCEQRRKSRGRPHPRQRWNLYGTTVAGGSTGAGTVFRVTPEGVLTTLFTFNNTNGPHPNGLVLANDGTFYGTTAFGGTNSFGTIFNVTTNGVFTTLFQFPLHGWASAQLPGR